MKITVKHCDYDGEYTDNGWHEAKCNEGIILDLEGDYIQCPKCKGTGHIVKEEKDEI